MLLRLDRGSVQILDRVGRERVARVSRTIVKQTGIAMRVCLVAKIGTTEVRMWDQPEEVIQAELAPGEQLLWTGRPPQGWMLRAVDAFLIPFGLLWSGCVVAALVQTIANRANWFGALFLVPFILVGLYFIFGRFLVDARDRQRTVYGITSERIIIVSGLRGRRVKSLNLDTLTDITLTESRGGGVITFGPLVPMWHWYAGSGWPGTGQQSVPRFELPGNAKQVYDVIRTASRKSRQLA
jgi:hypothetical protein